MSFRAPSQSSPKLSGAQALVSLIPTQEHLLPQENQWFPRQASPGWAEWLACHVSSPWGDQGMAEGSQARTRLCCTEQRSLLGAKVSADGPLFAENPPEVLVTQSCPTLCDPMDCQTPLLMGFSRQEYWSGLPFPPPGDLLDAGVKPASPALQAGSLPLSHLGNQEPRWIPK